MEDLLEAATEPTESCLKYTIAVGSSAGHKVKTGTTDYLPKAVNHIHR
jgi:hypothetical protein